MDLDEMLHVDGCRDMDELINFWARSGQILEPDLHRIFVFQRDIWTSYGQISMKFNGSIANGAWTNWWGFELDPDHSPYPGSGFTPDFWILAGYLNKLWTDFDEILWVDSCRGLHDLVTFWAGCGSESGSWIRTCIQNCKADSAKSNGRISIRFYEWIACESRKTALNSGSDTDHIRDAVSVSGFYPDWLRRILTKFGAEMAPMTGKSWVSCRSSRSKIKVKQNKNTYFRR